MANSNTIISDLTERGRDITISDKMHRKPHFARRPSVKLLQRRDLSRRGIAMIWVAIFIGLIILLVGLSVDAAKVCLLAHQLQNGADAVALYVGDGADFPNGTALTTANLIDALVYDTDDVDDTEASAAYDEDLQSFEDVATQLNLTDRYARYVAESAKEVMKDVRSLMSEADEGPK